MTETPPLHSQQPAHRASQLAFAASDKFVIFTLFLAFDAKNLLDTVVMAGNLEDEVVLDRLSPRQEAFEEGIIISGEDTLE